MGPRGAALSAPHHATMKVTVAGLWHLGCVTAACLAAAGHDLNAFDDDPSRVAELRDGRLPVDEPGLAALVAEQMSAGRLRFSSDPASISSSDVLWITWDTPVDDQDRSDVQGVFVRVEPLLQELKPGALVIVSSQLPAGSVARLEARFAELRPFVEASFACLPENLRLGSAIRIFREPDRVVAGVRHDRDRDTITALLAPITSRIEWMRVESAEMAKHATNAFLAMSITFMNEIAAVCERVGADAGEVSRALKTEARIGPRAYLSPGGAFAGGTLARDVVSLSNLAGEAEALPVVRAIRESNDRHRQWAAGRLRAALNGVAGRRVAVWGLTYKPGTDTLRRSSAIELCEGLLADGAAVRAYDPAVKAVPDHLRGRLTLAATAADAARGADALVIATEWPEFRDASAALTAAERPRVILDAGRFTAASFAGDPGVRYISVGRSH